MNTDEFAGDMIRPFQLETSNLRGRIVRFHDVLDNILTPHDYPDIINQLLGETLTICALFSSLMKYEGIFSLQITGDGPISMIVADITSTGHIRGCATFDKEKLKEYSALEEASPENVTALNPLSMGSLKPFGKGYMTFTVDQGLKIDRYQGIVELKGDSLADSIAHYFKQSEQIETGIVLSVGRVGKAWRASGLILQQMPHEGGHAEDGVSSADTADEDWNRSNILLQSCTQEELLSEKLNSHDILMRLFHEDGIRVFEPTPMEHKCRCSQERVQNVYDMLSEEEQRDVVVEGKIEMTCDFCSTTYKLVVDE